MLKMKAVLLFYQEVYYHSQMVVCLFSSKNTIDDAKNSLFVLQLEKFCYTE